MTTATAAFNVIKARLEANVPDDSQGNPVTLRWQNEDGDPLPSTPAAFVYTEFLADPASIASYGGGRGANRYRNTAQIVCYVFVPRGWGLVEATTIAETVGALFRSYRDSDISCFEASVMPGGDGASIKPPGMDSEVDNYFYAVMAAEFFYDQIG